MLHSLFKNFECNLFKICGLESVHLIVLPRLGLTFKFHPPFPLGQTSDVTKDGYQIIRKSLAYVFLERNLPALHYKMVVVVIWNTAKFTLQCLPPLWLLKAFLTWPLCRNQEANGNTPCQHPLSLFLSHSRCESHANNLIIVKRSRLLKV
jgi:hypothetical protein